MIPSNPRLPRARHPSNSRADPPRAKIATAGHINCISNPRPASKASNICPPEVPLSPLNICTTIPPTYPCPPCRQTDQPTHSPSLNCCSTTLQTTLQSNRQTSFLRGSTQKSTFHSSRVQTMDSAALGLPKPSCPSRLMWVQSTMRVS